MGAKIVLAAGQALTRPIESTDLKPARIRRYLPLDEIARRLDYFELTWQELAEEQEQDIRAVEIDLYLLFDDLRRMFDLPEKHPEELTEPIKIM
jgi:hypothetical protein